MASPTLLQPLCLLRGFSKTYPITVFDQNGSPVDLTGATLYFSISLTAGGVVEVVKSSAVPSEILILTQSGATLGMANIFLVPADTSALPLGLHKYDVAIVLSGGERHPVILPNDFRLEPSVTVIP